MWPHKVEPWFHYRYAKINLGSFLRCGQGIRNKANVDTLKWSHEVLEPRFHPGYLDANFSGKLLVWPHEVKP